MSALRDHLRRLRSGPAVTKPTPAAVAKPTPAPVAKPTPAAVPKPKSAPVAKPTPAAVPKPKSVPPAPETAATKPKLPYYGAQLPVVALTAADVPRDKKVVQGTLLHGENSHTGRPLVMLCVPCNCWESEHCYPWRSDWPVDFGVRSHQVSRCRKHRASRGVWLALDPGRVGRSLEVVLQMRAELVTWKLVQVTKKRIQPPAQETTHV